MRHRNGYTLVELMVVVALLAILMVGVISLFLTNLRISSKASGIARIKQEGDYASSNVERTLRYAKSIITGVPGCTCVNSMSSLCYESFADSAVHRIELSADHRLQVNDNHGVGPASYRLLTSTNVTIGATDLSINCTAATPKVGNVIVASVTVRDPHETDLFETFTTRVVLRNKPE
jgi:prepilin-type N-terminal cleavage/methylation domain-containing protein